MKRFSHTLEFATLVFLTLFGFYPKTVLSAAKTSDMEFRAKQYTRDLQTNTAKGKGDAWLKIGTKEIWADEIEADFTANRAIANGNVRIRDGDVSMWATHASYYFKGDEATLEDATVVSGQIVMTGNVVHKKSRTEYEIDEGTYSNCNIDLIRDKDVGHCDFDWKIYGRNFSVTFGGYLHIQDALVYVKKLPVLYLPYFIAPVKTERESGFLIPYVSYSQNLGSGVTVPYYLNLGKWHDLTLVPTYYSKTGYYIGLNYRYTYSPAKSGEANVYFTQRRFSDTIKPGVEDVNRARTLGFMGEWAVMANNTYSLGNRSHTRQLLQMVSHPYFYFDYGGALGNQALLSFLRSQITYTRPTDQTLLTAQIQHLQPLILTDDRGVDGGSVTQLPRISFSKITTPLLDQYLSWEFDSQLTNFFRLTEFDNVPKNPAKSGINVDENLNYDNNDYIRAGRRLQVEPRLIANFPLGTGIQLQPVLRAGTFLYHFDLPTSQFIHHEYVNTEIPVSMYLSKTFQTGIKGFEKVNHVIQPRVIYARTLAQSFDPDHPDHPFFSRTLGTAGNPPFDIYDQMVPFEYTRFEFINRFRRKSSDGIERFFLLQLSEQYNIRTSQLDPRYSQSIGPIELLSELKLWRVSAQTQVLYPLNLVNDTRESVWSTSISYTGDRGDSLTFGFRLANNHDITLKEETLYFSAYKRLPIFFNIGGNAEYSMRGDGLRGFQVGFYFGSKPRECWSLALVTGQNSIRQPFASLSFRFDFGAPSAVTPH